MIQPPLRTAKNDRLLILDMAENFYGFGRWDSPFWFIGPEPGMTKAEGEDLAPRAKAWRSVGGTELVDCVAYHEKLKIHRFHRPNRPALQPTWHRLMTFMFAVAGERLDNEILREYQRTRLGVLDPELGTTCIAELSSLAANNNAVSRDRAQFLLDRSRVLAARLADHHPVFVLFYGDQKKFSTIWGQICGVGELPHNQPRQDERHG